MGTIRYRPGWRQLPWWSATTAIPVAGSAYSVDHAWPWVGAVLGATAFLHVVVLFAVRQFGAVLTPDRLVVYSVRTRRVPWRDVEWVGPVRRWGEDRVAVAVGGRLIHLRAPATSRIAPDPEFGAKAREFHDYWVAHRGPDWRPPAPRWPGAVAGAPAGPAARGPAA